ncbi:MAG: signal peptidase I [Acidimicrobiales bacterium]
MSFAYRAMLGILIAGAITVAVGVGSGNYQIRPVLSGSMRPTLPLGGVVVTQRVPLSALRTGDIAVFHPPGYATIDYVHRITWLKHTTKGDLIRTKGDANLYPDPWTLRVKGNVAYVARFSLPLLGYPAVWIHSPSGRRILLYCAGTLFLLAALSAMINDRRRSRIGRSVEGDHAESDEIAMMTSDSTSKHLKASDGASLPIL